MIRVVPFTFGSTGLKAHQYDTVSDAAEIERVINEQEARLKARYEGFIPQAINYESLERHVHLIFREVKNVPKT